jgi:hypothetical protein
LHQQPCVVPAHNQQHILTAAITAHNQQPSLRPAAITAHNQQLRPATITAQDLNMDHFFLPIRDTADSDTAEMPVLMLDEQSSLFSFSDEENSCHGNQMISPALFGDLHYYCNNNKEPCLCCYGDDSSLSDYPDLPRYGNHGLSPLTTELDACAPWQQEELRDRYISHTNAMSLLEGDATLEDLGMAAEETLEDADMMMASRISVMDIAMAEDMMKFLRLNPPHSRTVAALQREDQQLAATQQANPHLAASQGSPTTMSEYSFGLDGLSLSDSCCEGFSSDGNDNEM